MGIITVLWDAVKDATVSTVADQWKEIITADPFDELTVVAPGVLKTRNLGRGTNTPGSDGVISNGSKIFVPQNAAAVIFNHHTIENTITAPGVYEYTDGDKSIMNGDGVAPIARQIKKRFGFGGISPDMKRIAFVNMREIRNLGFGTPGPQIYNDPAYGLDLEIHAWGSFSIQIVDPKLFIQSFVPAGVFSYTLDDPKAKRQLANEFIQSFSVALNSMSTMYRVAQLPSLENEITSRIAKDAENAGTWKDRFGLVLVKASVASIELSDSSKELIKRYAAKKIELSAYEGVSPKASDISAQQKIAQGIQDHGLGNMGGMVFGVNLAQGLDMNGRTRDNTGNDISKQLEIVKQLKDALDCGILTQEEFDAKKKEVLGL